MRSRRQMISDLKNPSPAGRGEGNESWLSSE
jgi:hypothetical protein